MARTSGPGDGMRRAGCRFWPWREETSVRRHRSPGADPEPGSPHSPVSLYYPLAPSPGEEESSTGPDDSPGLGLREGKSTPSRLGEGRSWWEAIRMERGPAGW